MDESFAFANKNAIDTENGNSWPDQGYMLIFELHRADTYVDEGDDVKHSTAMH